MLLDKAHHSPADLLCALTALNAAYARAIDGGELEAWPEFFVERGRYEIIPRENIAQGLPVALISCLGAPMMRDRVAAIRRANLFAPHVYRHVIGMSVVIDDGPQLVRTSTNFAVFQTRLDPIDYGQTIVYAVGEYLDLIDVGSSPRFHERIAITDTAKIPTLLATPL
jgi:anthranilate 1,2-dioxygenase small subunit